MGGLEEWGVGKRQAKHTYASSRDSISFNIHQGEQKEKR